MSKKEFQPFMMHFFKPLSTLLKTLLKIFFAGFIFLLPLYYSFETQQIFEVNKFWLLTCFIGTILLVGAIINYQKYSSSAGVCNTPLQDMFPRNFWIFSGIFFLSILISSLLAQTPVTAFLGGTSRHQGAVFLLMMFFLFIFSYFTFSENITKSGICNTPLQNKIQNIVRVKNIRNFLLFPLLASAIISSWIAIEQYSGNFSGIFSNSKIFDFHILSIQDVSMRSFGAMGQPNFLAQFLLLPFFLSIYLIVKNIFTSLNISEILIGIISTILIFLAIHATGSRAGEFVGLGIGSIIFITFVGLNFSEFSPEKKQKIFWGIISFLVFLGITLVSYIFYTPEILTHTGERARSILARMQFWKESLPLITQNFSTFFFGIGGDQLGYTFQPIASVRLNELEGFSYSPDRTHTIFLDFILHYGIIAGLIFWGFLLRIFWKTSQVIFNPSTKISEKSLLMSIFSGLIATLGSWSVGFYVTTDASIFMIFLGILGVFTLPSKTIGRMQYASTPKLFRNIIFSALFIVLSISLFHLASITKNSERARYQNALSSQNPEKTLSQEEIETYLQNAPYLQENFLTLQTEEIIEKAEQFGFNSFTFQYQKFDLSRKKEDFEKAKKSAGNSIESNVALFELAEISGIFTHEELVSYAKEIYPMVPEKYYTPANWMKPEIQKFWKHHQKFVIILEWVDK